MNKVDVHDVLTLQLYKQNLLHDNAAWQSDEDWQTFFHRVGYVQLDSMNVLLRSQDLFFWSRYPHYRVDELNELYRKQHVLEYYLFALCLVPVETAAYLDHSYSLRHRALLDDKNAAFLHEIYEQSHHSVQKYSRDFQSEASSDTEENRRETWNVSPVRGALDKLWRAGLIEVSRDANFNKLYRRTPRSFHEWQEMEADDLLISHLVDKGFENMGVLSPKELKPYFSLPPAAMRRVLHRLLEQQIIQEIQVSDQSEPQYIRTVDIPLLERAASARGEVATLLSPFDNMIRNRDRLQRLFGIDYKLESYIPPDKRKYGYFALPILVGQRIVGVVDLKNERSTRTLIVKKLTLFKRNMNPHTMDQVQDCISRLQSFLGCDHLEYENNREVYV